MNIFSDTINVVKYLTKRMTYIITVFKNIVFKHLPKFFKLNVPLVKRRLSLKDVLLKEYNLKASNKLIKTFIHFGNSESMFFREVPQTHSDFVTSNFKIQR